MPSVAGCIQLALAFTGGLDYWNQVSSPFTIWETILSCDILGNVRPFPNLQKNSAYSAVLMDRIARHWLPHNFTHWMTISRQTLYYINVQFYTPSNVENMWNCKTDKYTPNKPQGSMREWSSHYSNRKVSVIIILSIATEEWACNLNVPKSC